MTPVAVYVAVPLALYLAVSWLVPEGSVRAALCAGLILLSVASVPVSHMRTYLLLRRPGDRKLWAWTTATGVALLVGEAADVARRLGAPMPDSTFTFISATAFLLAAVFGVFALWCFARPGQWSGAVLAGFAVDLLVLVLTAVLASLIILLPATRAGLEFSLGRVLLLSLYPSLVVAVAAYALIFKRTPWSKWEVALIAWLAILGLKHVLQFLWIDQSYWSPPGAPEVWVTDMFLILAYLAGAVAGILRIREASPAGAWDKGANTYPAWPSFVAPAVVVALVPLIYMRTMDRSWSDAEIWVAVGVAVVLGMATSVRAWLLQEENAQLQQHSTSDSLTGLVNHRHFHERLETELMRAQREGVPLSVALFDVDDFDRVNNIYGHQAGDRRLCSIAESIDLSSRTFDVACRTGGDEFALIMPDADPIAAYRVCLRIAERLAEEDGVCPEPSTLSAGIATYPEHAEERDEIVHRADGALYWAKYHEGGSVVIYDPDSVRALGPEQRIALLEEESYLNMVQMLAVAADARDPYTQRHSRDVADFAILLAEDLGFDEERIALLKTAALLHDVGKIGIPDSILKKPGRLSEEEYGLVQGHPELAVHILGSIPRQEILPWILSHHEHWDGGGYPQGLAGAAVPLEARILALCDAYDAMTTDRPYRGSMSHAEACEEIVACAGTQFDPDLAQRFVDLFSEHLATTVKQ